MNPSVQSFMLAATIKNILIGNGAMLFVGAFCILLLETFHHLRWTLLPQISIYSDYVLPDIAMSIFGMIYAVSLLVHPYGSAKEPEQYVDTGTH